MDLNVRTADDDADLLTAARVDHTSFGIVSGRGEVGREELQRSLAWRRRTQTYLAEIDAIPVGTARLYDFALSVPGGGSVAASGVGDVGVLPTHNGRGVFSALMHRMLDDATAAGSVAAVLYASEATIYGRHGFGPATRASRVRIPAQRAELRTDLQLAPGTGVYLESDDWLPVIADVFEASRTRRGGEVDRSPEIWDKLLEPLRGDRFCLVHRDERGEAVGYALYRVAESWETTGPEHTMTVDEVVAVDAPTELSLWSVLLSTPLVRNIECRLPADSILFDALNDRWSPSKLGEHDNLWVRILDPVAALSSRRYRTGGSLVLAVVGAGATAVLDLGVSPDGEASVSLTDAQPELSLGLEELGSVWLGGGSFAQLAAVGRVVEAHPGAAGRADALFGWSPSPWVTHDF